MKTNLSSPDRSPLQEDKVDQSCSSAGGTKSNRTQHRSLTSRTHLQNLDRKDGFDGQALRDKIRHLVDQDMDLFAHKTLQLAKRGHKSALDFVFDSLREPINNSGSAHLSKIGSISRLDEIADAQRHVIMAAAHNEITPAQAIHYMKMLNELGCALKNSELQYEVDEIRRYLNEN